MPKHKLLKKCTIFIRPAKLAACSFGWLKSYWFILCLVISLYKLEGGMLYFLRILVVFRNSEINFYFGICNMKYQLPPCSFNIISLETKPIKNCNNKLRMKIK